MGRQAVSNLNHYGPCQNFLPPAAGSISLFACLSGLGAAGAGSNHIAGVVDPAFVEGILPLKASRPPFKGPLEDKICHDNVWQACYLFKSKE
jgi:hypothetical protein